MLPAGNLLNNLKGEQGKEREGRERLLLHFYNSLFLSLTCAIKEEI